MIKNKFYTAKYDRVFKTVLCDRDDKELLQEFLSRILERKVEIIEFLRNELPVNTKLERVKIVDVLVKVDGEYVHIEEIKSHSRELIHELDFINNIQKVVVIS